MSVGRVSRVLEIAKGQAWAKDFRFWADQPGGAPRVLQAASGSLRRQGGSASAPPAALALTVENGRVQLVDHVCGLRLSDVDVAGLAPGPYDLVVNVTDDLGRPRQVRAVAKVLP